VDGIGKETPLTFAATTGSTDILKCLVLAGADANVTDSVSYFFLSTTRIMSSIPNIAYYDWVSIFKCKVRKRYPSEFAYLADLFYVFLVHVNFTFVDYIKMLFLIHED
jgi:hypothetical protein